MGLTSVVLAGQGRLGPETVTQTALSASFVFFAERSETPSQWKTYPRIHGSEFIDRPFEKGHNGLK
jgi:hypothetical protein